LKDQSIEESQIWQEEKQQVNYLIVFLIEILYLQCICYNYLILIQEDRSFYRYI